MMKCYRVMWGHKSPEFAATEFYSSKADAMRVARRQAKNLCPLWDGGVAEGGAVVVTECKVATDKQSVIAYLNGRNPILEGMEVKHLFWNEEGESSKLLPYGQEREF
jgi:hypothetical protein